MIIIKLQYLVFYRIIGKTSETTIIAIFAREIGNVVAAWNNEKILEK